MLSVHASNLPPALSKRRPRRKQLAIDARLRTTTVYALNNMAPAPTIAMGVLLMTMLLGLACRACADDVAGSGVWAARRCVIALVQRLKRFLCLCLCVCVCVCVCAGVCIARASAVEHDSRA